MLLIIHLCVCITRTSVCCFGTGMFKSGSVTVQILEVFIDVTCRLFCVCFMDENLFCFILTKTD